MARHPCDSEPCAGEFEVVLKTVTGIPVCLRANRSAEGEPATPGSQ